MMAYIIRTQRTAMQSGKAKAKQWRVRLVEAGKKKHDSRTGWVGGASTETQVNLRFASQADAVAYVKTLNIPYIVQNAPSPQMKVKNYGDNFSHRRRSAWTH